MPTSNAVSLSRISSPNLSAKLSSNIPSPSQKRKMKPTTFFVSFLLTSVLALPTAPPDDGKGKPQKNQCVQMPDAQRFISRWTGFLDGEGSDLGDAKATAEALVADNFEQYSFSSTSLSGQSVKKPEDGAGLIRKGKQSYIEHVAGSTM